MTHFREETCKLKTMRILISGAGIAGPTLAYWLAHYGFQPTLVERAPHLRTGGRNQVMNLLRIPWVADRSFAADLTDELTLPQY